MTGLFMPIVLARKAGLARTYISGSSPASSVGPTSASSKLQRRELALVDPDRRPEQQQPHRRSLISPDSVLSTVSKPLSLRSATSAPDLPGAPRPGS